MTDLPLSSEKKKKREEKKMFFSHEGGKKWGHTYCLALSDLAEMYSFLNFYLLLCY